jgi:hypothetical protein
MIRRVFYKAAMVATSQIKNGSSQMYTFNKLQSLINKSRSKNPKILNNTRARMDGDRIVIRFWDTDIIKVDASNRYIIQVEGFFTKTTKDRINQITSAQVSQKKGIWYIGSTEFFDGITVDESGSILNAPMDHSGDSDIKIIKKMIDTYVKDLVRNWDTLPDPSGGDCFFCAGLFGSTDNDHLYAHLTEGYLMKRLAYNAMKDTGYHYPELFLDNMSMVKREVRKYFNKRMTDLLKIHRNESSNSNVA